MELLRLAEIAETLPEDPSWSEPWLRLGPESTWGDRLLVCRAIRDSGSLAAEIGDFLVSWAIEELAIAAESERADGLAMMNRRESRRASDRIVAELLEEHGEGEMAQRFRTDPKGYARRREVGRRFFFGASGSEPPEDAGWLAGFVEAVSSGLLTDPGTGKLGVRYREEGGFWEISVYPLPADAVDRTIDGPARSRGLAWDIEDLRSLFDRIDGLGWYASCGDEAESPYLWLEGGYRDHEVFLRLLPGKPDPMEPGETDR